MIARRLGITQAALRRELKAGESLGQIAGARGLTVAQLRRAVLGAVDAQIARAIH